MTPAYALSTSFGFVSSPPDTRLECSTRRRDASPPLDLSKCQHNVFIDEKQKKRH
jgi:hypothetical protein